MLFVGNSYTQTNDLDRAVAEVFASAGEAVEASRLASGGWRFVDHLAAAGVAGSEHAVALAAPQDWVVLQEQSQIPGFPDGQADVEASRDAAVALDALAAGTGGGTLFLMTWGRRDGDPTNPTLYPDFPTMQAHLADGYLRYVALASADGTPAWVAPAGLAWQRVHDDVLAAGADPATPGSPFARLYLPDGSHPSPRGTYLTACVVYASLTGRSPEGLAAPAVVSDAPYLQAVAAAVVLQGAGIDYPWSLPADTGAHSGAAGAHTGPPAPSGSGAADDPPGAALTGGRGASGAGRGRGCETSSGGSGLLGALAGLARRVRSGGSRAAKKAQASSANSTSRF